MLTWDIVLLTFRVWKFNFPSNQSINRSTLTIPHHILQWTKGMELCGIQCLLKANSAIKKGEATPLVRGIKIHGIFHVAGVVRQPTSN